MIRDIWMYVYTVVLASALPQLVYAHEVYVLDPSVTAHALVTPRFSEFAVIVQSLPHFLLWAFIAVGVVFVVFFVSISRAVERSLDPWLATLPPYAPFISRVTIGASFLAAAYYGALFGPELPLAATFGGLADSLRVLLAILGSMIILGLYVRLAAAICMMLFGVEVWAHGAYMLTYTNYIGELIVLLILGAHIFAVHTKHHDLRNMPRWLLSIKQLATPYAFFLLRVAFGTSLLYASLYAKVFNNQLALAVTATYPQIVTFFGLEPHFLIVGAAIVEICIGLFFILGIEIRFTALFLLFWLSLSLWYFGEVVWPHLILIGIPIAFFFYGYDKYSLEGFYFKRNGREPVL